jgi:vancomycin resistance protein YoaR
MVGDTRLASQRATLGPMRRRWLIVGVPVLVVALLVGGWAVDGAASSGQVPRNVTLDGSDVGGSTKSELKEAVHKLATGFAGRKVEITAGANTYSATAKELGLAVDEAATVTAAMRVDDDVAAPLRPLAWALSFARTRSAPVRYEVDRATLDTAVVTLQGQDRTAPAEAQLTAGAAGVQVVPAVPGEGIDAAVLATLLVGAAERGGAPLEVTAPVGPVPPQFSDPDAQAVADDANRLMANPLALTVAGRTGTVPRETMWGWARIAVDGDRLTLALDATAVEATLTTLFPATTEAKDAAFDVVDGAPVLIDSQDGTVCCEPGSPASILAGLRAGTTPVEVALTVTHPAFTTEAAQALGITEEVGQPDQFGPTTHHAAGEARVTNIHRIADIVRGHVIKPGETLSVNDFVGPRTAEKGFVDAPVIYNGTFQHDIGGGVSQFATTTFNAALFAGLDFGEYQSHSIVISRYPRGHEATISYPHPDLQIKNTTPYGILLWPTYTASSLTVHLYSTHYVDVALGATSDKAVGHCTRVTTPRTRTYTDGTVKNDSVSALYRPGEGVNC